MEGSVLRSLLREYCVQGEAQNAFELIPGLQNMLMRKRKGVGGRGKERIGKAERREL